MERPIWSGELSFGIVSIAVRMFPALRDRAIHFHQISKKDHRRIRYLKVAEGDRNEVPAAEIAKGYAVGNGKYVLFTDEELQRLSPAKSKNIAITSFAKIDEIDPRLFDRPYYLAAQERSEKAYRLLAEALERSERVGIAQMVMHGREHLVAVRAIAGVLAVETMHFQDELVKPTAFKPASSAAGKVNQRELDMAAQLIESMSEPFTASDYEDEFRHRVQQAISKKSRGKPFLVEETEADPGAGKVINLMDALRQSIDRSKRPVRPKGKRGSTTPRRRHAS